MPLRIGVLASGSLGYLTLEKIGRLITPLFIFTDRQSNDIIDYAKAHDISVLIGNPRQGRATPILKCHPVDVIFSVNYLFLVEDDVLKHPCQYAINLHGSLLPKYRGRTPHVWAIINGEKETGVTAHLMDSGCDTGDMVAQIKIPIDGGDTGGSILNKFEQVYPDIILDLIENISQGSIYPVKQDHSMAVYFGKRSPEDGCIDWNWQVDRIYNWVRAQSHPYPGAFSYLKQNKIIIDKVSLSETGFSWDMPNGFVLDANPCPLVKVPNGVIRIDTIRDPNTMNIQKGDQFE